MKNKLHLLVLAILSYTKLSAQIICVYCYHQNDSISYPVNNLVQNGGFETSTCSPGNNFFCPNSSNYNCDISSWTCNGGGSSTYAQLYDTTIIWGHVAEGNKAVYFGNNYSNSCSTDPNDTSCINNVSCTVNGISSGYPYNVAIYGGSQGISLQQNVNGLILGNTYVLEFWSGGEYTNNYPNRGLFAVDVGFGNIYLRCKRTFSTGTGIRYIIIFNSIANSQTIKFTNWGHCCATCTELMIDDVKLYTLAELSPAVSPCNMGIGESETVAYDLYPNPFSDKINLRIMNAKNAEFTLYDITSRKLFQKQIMSSIALDVEALENGIYIYEVNCKNQVIKKGKIIKK
jgi:hypothetical protein